MQNSMNLLKQYILRPMKLIFSNSSIIILVLFVLLLDKVSETNGIGVSSNIQDIVNGFWAFELLPASVKNLFGSPLLGLSGLLSYFSSKTYRIFAKYTFFIPYAPL